MNVKSLFGPKDIWNEVYSLIRKKVTALYADVCHYGIKAVVYTNSCTTNVKFWSDLKTL